MTLAQLQIDYEAALPRILRHARIKLRAIRDPGQFDDALQDVVGIGWVNFMQCAKDGKDPNQFVSAIADYAVRHVKVGRHVMAQDRPNDVLSPRAQRARGFTVGPMPEQADFCTRVMNALADTRQASPLDQAAFRTDTPEWLATLGKKRPIVEGMANGESTKDLAAQFGKSPGRIAQIRGEAAESYRRFHGEGR